MVVDVFHTINHGYVMLFIFFRAND